MTSEIKPCPCKFCGKGNSLVEMIYCNDFARICQECQARGPMVEVSDIEWDTLEERDEIGERKATAAWNNRAGEVPK